MASNPVGLFCWRFYGRRLIKTLEDMGMTKNPFIKAVFEALEDEIDRVDFKASREYTAKRKEIEAVMKTLECLPETVETETGPVNVRALLEDLGESYEHLFGIGFDIAIKQGFFTAFRLLFYSLTAEPGECLSDKEI